MKVDEDTPLLRNRVSRFSTLLEEQNQWEHTHQKLSNFVTLCFFLCGCGFAVQFILWKANSAGAQYPFKINNLYFSTALIILAISSVVAMLRNNNPFQHINAPFLFKICTVSVPLALMDNISMFGLLYTSAQTAAALWYTKIMFAAFMTSLLHRQIPKGMNLSTLASIFMTISLFVLHCQSNQGSLNPQEILGMGMILVAMAFGTAAEVFSDHFLGENMTGVSMNEQFFWFALTMAPINFVLIFAEGYAYDNFSWYDLIPCHSFTTMTYVLLGFWVVFNYLMVYTASVDLKIYIIMSYTANIIQIVLQNALNGFQDFDPSTFLMALIVFANAISYNLAHIEEERNEKAHTVHDYFTHHGFQCIDKIQDKAHKCPEFGSAYRRGLQEALSHAEEFCNFAKP